MKDIYLIFKKDSKELKMNIYDLYNGDNIEQYKKELLEFNKEFKVIDNETSTTGIKIEHELNTVLTTFICYNQLIIMLNINIFHIVGIDEIYIRDKDNTLSIKYLEAIYKIAEHSEMCRKDDRITINFINSNFIHGELCMVNIKL